MKSSWRPGGTLEEVTFFAHHYTQELHDGVQRGRENGTAQLNDQMQQEEHMQAQEQQLQGLHLGQQDSAMRTQQIDSQQHNEQSERNCSSQAKHVSLVGPGAAHVQSPVTRAGAPLVQAPSTEAGLAESGSSQQQPSVA